MDPISLSSGFSRLATDMANARGQLSAQENRRLYPDHSWGNGFRERAETLDNYRTATIAMAPQAGQLITALSADVRQLARVGGKLDIMASYRVPMAGGWAATYDRPIADALAAAEMLLHLGKRPGPKAA